MGRLRLWDLVVRFRFARVDDVWKFDGILDEENRDVIAHNVPVSLLRVELDGKATDITNCVCGASASKHS